MLHYHGIASGIFMSAAAICLGNLSRAGHYTLWLLCVALHRFALSHRIIPCHTHRWSHIALSVCLQEVEPSKGHILVLSYTPSNNKLALVEQLEVHGSVYNLCAFQVMPKPCQAIPIKHHRLHTHVVDVQQS